MSWVSKIAGALLLCCPFLLTGCPGEKTPPKAAPPAPRVGISLAGLNGDQDQAIKQTMESHKDGEKAQLFFADAQGDSQKQKKDVEQLISEKVAAVVLEPVDPVGARDLIERLTRAKIRAVALNVLPADTPVDAYVSFDLGGARTLLIRAAVASGAAAKGTSLVLTVAGRDQPGLWSTQGGAAGLLTQVRQFAQSEVLAAKKTSLLKPEDRPVVVLADDAALAVAAVRDLVATGTPPAFAAGIGSSKAAFRLVSEGKLSGEVDTRPEEEAAHALSAALALAGGKPVARHELIDNGSYSVPAQIVPVRLITRQNLYLLDKKWYDGPASGSIDGSGGQSGGSQTKTNILRIITEEGKTIEVHYQGKLKKIEQNETQGG